MPHDTPHTELPMARGQVAILRQRQVWQLQRGLLLQQRRWTDDMLILRTGSVEQRLGHWLELLSRAGGAAASSDEVPTLREIATLVDAAPETVCRVLARLRAPDPAPVRTKARPARWAAPLRLAAF